MAQVAYYAPEKSEGVNGTTRVTNKLYARQKSFDYHYYQYKDGKLVEIHLIKNV